MKTIASSKILLGALATTALILNSPSLLAVPYTVSSSAYNHVGTTEGTDSASVSNDGATSQASVDDFNLHSYSEISGSTVVNKISGSGAQFIQLFKVVEAGEVSFEFAWDGTVHSNGNITAGYGIYVNIYPTIASETEFGYDYGINTEISSNETQSFDLNEAYSYTFVDDDINSTFYVDMSLHTYVGLLPHDTAAGDTATVAADGTDDRLAYSDFGNTGAFSFSGDAVAPVPVPAAVWLLGSALIGLVGMRRKQKI